MVISLIKKLDDLCADIEQTNPAADLLSGWKSFFDAEIDPEEPIPHLLHALDKAFSYRTYDDNEVKQVEVDDLATRKAAWERAAPLCEHENEIRPPTNTRNCNRPPKACWPICATSSRAFASDWASWMIF